MSPGILGKKIGMTQVFSADGQVVPVTVLKAGPCVVVQRKTPTSDGYDAVQLGLMEYAKKTGVNKPSAGHLKKSGAEGVKSRAPASRPLANSDALARSQGLPVAKIRARRPANPPRRGVSLSLQA